MALIHLLHLHADSQFVFLHSAQAYEFIDCPSGLLSCTYKLERILVLAVFDGKPDCEAWYQYLLELCSLMRGALVINILFEFHYEQLVKINRQARPQSCISTQAIKLSPVGACPIVQVDGAALRGWPKAPRLSARQELQSWRRTWEVSCSGDSGTLISYDLESSLDRRVGLLRLLHRLTFSAILGSTEQRNSSRRNPPGNPSGIGTE
jgi:hypothetical protein